MSKQEWLDLRREVYGPHDGALNNRTGATFEQYEAEAALKASGISGFELLFGQGSPPRPDRQI